MNQKAALGFWSVLLATLVIASAIGWIGWGEALWIFAGAGVVAWAIIALQRRQARAR